MKTRWRNIPLTTKNTPATFETGAYFEKAYPWYRDFEVMEVSRKSVDQTWEQPWGAKRFVRDHHNELVVRFTNTQQKDIQFDVRVRVFNDGVGFRYEYNGTDALNITRELTSFGLQILIKLMRIGSRAKCANAMSTCIAHQCNKWKAWCIRHLRLSMRMAPTLRYMRRSVTRFCGDEFRKSPTRAFLC